MKRVSGTGATRRSPRPDSTRYAGNRGPESARAHRLYVDGDTPGRSDAVGVRIKRSRLGVCRVTSGFALSSIALPSAHAQEASGPGESAGSTRLRGDLRAALLPLLERMPESTALAVEYRIEPVLHGAPRVGVLVLVETAALSEADALRQARELRGELRIALATLASWYAFADADLNLPEHDFERGRRVHLKPGVVAFGSTGTIGFVKPRGAALLTVPAMLEHGDRDQPAWFASQWAPALARTLQAAATMPMPVGLRFTLTREALAGEQAQRLHQAAGSLQVLDQSVSDAEQATLGAVQVSAAAAFAQAFATRPDFVRLDIEASAEAPLSELFLRLAGNELLPRTPLEIAHDGQGKASGPRALQVIDLSMALPHPAWLPPILPDPWQLQRLSFPQHMDNVAVQLPAQGLALGTMMQGGFRQPVHLAEADRSRHVYLLGATGTGKSTLVYNMARQDIEGGRGVAVIDPHGDLFDQLLDSIPPERAQDVVIIDPSDARHPVGLNPMVFAAPPSDREIGRLITELMEMMLELHPELREWSARFEQFFRNGVQLLLEAEPHPSFERLIGVYGDQGYRANLLSRCRNQKVQVFFDMAGRTSYENALDNWGPSITSKFSGFVDNPVLHAMLCAPRRTVDYRAVMDERKILLVNLAKGAIGTLDARLIGMLITDGLFQAALSRHDVARDKRLAYTVYLDEFQNFTTRAIADILAEARKYGLRMVLAHQTLGQLVDARLSPPTRLVDAVLGNVATKLFLRVGLDEARMLEANLLPQFDARMLAQLPDRHVMCRLLVDNRPSPPFVFSTLAPAPLPPAGVRAKSRQAALEGSRARYGMESPAPPPIAPPPGPVVAATAGRAAQAAVALFERRRHRLPCRPEAGAFFQTWDDALGFVAMPWERSGYRTLILRAGIGGTAAGRHHVVDFEGRMEGGPTLWRLAHSLLQRLPLEPVDADSRRGDAMNAVASDAIADVTARAITGAGSGPGRCPPVGDELFRTRNGSLVLTGPRSDAMTGVVVVQGGQRVDADLPGHAPGEWYGVDADGRALVPAGAARELSPISLLEFSGLDLVSHVWLRWPDGRLEDLAGVRMPTDGSD